MKENVREKGYLAEQAFIKILYEHGIPFEYLDDWVDFKIYDVFVDVKSSRLSHKFTDKNAKTKKYKIGRFDITDTQREKKPYLALFVRHANNFLFMGITKIKEDTPRYISIHKTRELGLLNIEEFIEQIKK